MMQATWSLSEAVNVMAEYQLGTTLAKDETGNIVAFLKALTGDQPSVIFPILPPSIENTPKPNRNWIFCSVLKLRLFEEYRVNPLYFLV